MTLIHRLVLFGGAILVGTARAELAVPRAPVDRCLRGTWRNPDKSVVPWVEGCPGFSLVEPGWYASAGQRIRCPPGTFSASFGASACEPCEAGYFCPERAGVLLGESTGGATNAREFVCGNASVYCPAGSAAPLVAESGWYTAGGGDGLKVSGPGGEALGDPTTRVEAHLCPRGFVCRDGVAELCPGGWYCADEGLAEASGPCEAGFYCPAGSTSARANACAGQSRSGGLEGSGSDVYCPTGSPRPQYVPWAPTGERGAGFSLGSDSDESSRSGARRIEARLCPPGFYCPEEPILGRGVRLPCPAGRYGDEMGLTVSECSGVCAPGYYCPPGSVRADQFPCGNASVYCPEGSSVPKPVPSGHFSAGGTPKTQTSTVPCTPGTFCTLGESHICPAGSYCSKSSLSAPEGLCHAGSYCPPASTSPTQLPCGNATVYCPRGSATPILAPQGWYTVLTQIMEGVVEEDGGGASAFLGVADVDEDVALFLGEGDFLDDVERRTDVLVCPRGWYCPGNGEKYACPAGRFGGVEGLVDAGCEGECEAGYLCGVGSVSGRERVCGGQDVYCEAGSWEPTMVPDGYEALGGEGVQTRTRIEVCEAGTYCVGGVKSRCPAGRFGGVEGMGDGRCEGECEAGYYCPAGSTSATEIACTGAGYFCPPGSGVPRPVSAGMYTAGGRTTEDGGETERSLLLSCAREFGVAERNGSVIRLSEALEAFANATGEASALLRGPVTVPFEPLRRCRAGFIGDAATRSVALECPAGYFCPGDGWRYECPPGRYGDVARMASDQCSGPCAPGHYCPWTSTSPRQIECGSADRACVESSGAPTPVPRGSYSLPLHVPTSQRVYFEPCPRGEYCVDGERRLCPAGRFGREEGMFEETCSGPCFAGFTCPQGATSPTTNVCGNSSVYCPAGSSVPLRAPSGTYTVGGAERVPNVPSNATRTSFRDCPIGHYCDVETNTLHQCPAGRWGNETKLTSPSCSGPCAPGHFCPPGSLSPRVFQCGDIFVAANLSTNITANVSAILGTVSLEDLRPEERLLAIAAAQIAAALDASAYTLGGAAVGAGTLGLASSGALVRMEGEDDEFVIDFEAGSRLKLPRVSFDLPSSAHAHALQVHGGPVSVYCPLASGWPLPVDPGFLSVGGSSQDNATRTHQIPCPKGHFCVAGIQHQCPPGTYGNETRLTSRFCSGTCPPAHYCPHQSTTPIPCPPATYAAGGAHICTPCPGNSADPNYSTLGPNRCRTSRNCCDP